MKATEKQINFIKIICKVLDIEFTGASKEEASQFISKNIKKFKRELELDNLYQMILHEDYGNRN